MKTIVCTLFMLVSAISYAGECHWQCPVTTENVGAYFDNDHFSWSDPQDVNHMAIGFGGAMLISTALNRYTSLKPWQSALIGAVAMGIIGTTKEVMFDTYTGRTDIKMYWAGGLTAGLAFTVLHF